MDTTMQELIFQTMMIIISVGLTAIGVYAKMLITTKIDVTKYGFENERVERILDNAVNYAEGRGKQYAKAKSESLASNKKLDFARQYINQVDPKIVAKYGAQLDDMIGRKVVQAIGTK